MKFVRRTVEDAREQVRDVPYTVEDCLCSGNRLSLPTVDNFSTLCGNACYLILENLFTSRRWGDVEEGRKCYDIVGSAELSTAHSPVEKSHNIIHNQYETPIVENLIK